MNIPKENGKAYGLRLLKQSRAEAYHLSKQRCGIKCKQKNEKWRMEDVEKDIAKIVINEGQIRDRLLELSKTLIHDYKDKEWTIIAVLNGSLVFLADLIRLIPVPIRLDTIDAATYGESTFPQGETKVIRQFKIDIEDKHVLVVDDIADTGSTLKRVLEDIKKYNPMTLKSCVLLNRVSRRRYNVCPEYCGFDIGDDYVVGYGLDYNNKYRNLPFIAVLKDECYRQEDFIH